MKNIKNIFIILFPFLFAILLWRLSVSVLNPGGILAIIPIFYYSFVRPKNWMPLLSLLVCFLIDYNFNTLFFWTAMYCAFYAANGFQNFLDITRQKFDGWFVFIGFFSVSIFILMLSEFVFTGFLRGFWMMFLVSVLYIPFVKLCKRITDD